MFGKWQGPGFYSRIFMDVLPGDNAQELAGYASNFIVPVIPNSVRDAAELFGNVVYESDKHTQQTIMATVGDGRLVDFENNQHNRNRIEVSDGSFAWLVETASKSVSVVFNAADVVRNEMIATVGYTLQPGFSLSPSVHLAKGARVSVKLLHGKLTFQFSLHTIARIMANNPTKNVSNFPLVLDNIAHVTVSDKIHVEYESD